MTVRVYYAQKIADPESDIPLMLREVFDFIKQNDFNGKGFGTFELEGSTILVLYNLKNSVGGTLALNLSVFPDWRSGRWNFLNLVVEELPDATLLVTKFDSIFFPWKQDLIKIPSDVKNPRLLVTLFMVHKALGLFTFTK